MQTGRSRALSHTAKTLKLRSTQLAAATQPTLLLLRCTVNWPAVLRADGITHHAGSLMAKR
jgi:hypothetical protein